MERLIYRQDSYVIRRQVFSLEIIDTSIPVAPEADPAAFDMSASSIRMTFKALKTDPNIDTDDADAPIKADITFDAGGAIVGTPRLFRLVPGTSAEDGELELTMDKDQTLALPLIATLPGDIQVTDANDEDFTIPVIWTIKTIDSYTNRQDDV